ncbi:MAG: hypothetical protein J5792_03465, partial [Bacteroidales bacterium]|nr:hypothetical protein [Bacteroidales bacterium]
KKSGQKDLNDISYTQTCISYNGARTALRDIVFYSTFAAGSHPAMAMVRPETESLILKNICYGRGEKNNGYNQRRIQTGEQGCGKRDGNWCVGE